MPDVSNFIIPESKQEGLYYIAKQLGEQQQAKAKAAKEAEKNKMVASKYVQNLVGNKHLYTGTPFDPLADQKVNTILTTANDMIGKGADVNEVTTAILPLIDEWNQYATSAKDYQTHVKESFSALGNAPGVDKKALRKKMDELAFPIDEKTGMPDVTKYDPNLNYADLALKEGDVFTNEGLTEFITKPTKIRDSKDATLTKSDGSSMRTRVDIVHPPIMIPENIGGKITFTPPYEIATDEDAEILHPDGEQKGKPIRLLSKDAFDTLPPNALAYIRQETRKLTQKNNIPLNSPQAEHLARAIAYQEISTIGNQYSSYNPVTVKKEAPNDKFYEHYNYRLTHPIQSEDELGVSGNAFDRIGSIKPVEAFSRTSVLGFPIATQNKFIDNGIVKSQNGDIQRGGTIAVKRENLPTDIIETLSLKKIPLDETVIMTVGDDGTIQGIQTPRHGILGRQDMENVQKDVQVKSKTVPKKVFGKPEQNKQPVYKNPTQKTGESTTTKTSKKGILD